jgi:hypothetical protein
MLLIRCNLRVFFVHFFVSGGMAIFPKERKKYPPNTDFSSDSQENNAITKTQKKHNDFDQIQKKHSEH